MTPRNAGLFAWLLVAALLVACREPVPVRINLEAIKAYQMELDGEAVIVSGTLRTFADPRHYWIENDALDRVALEGGEDLAPIVGQTVEVSGVFRYDPERGRRIEVDQLRKLP